jgi:hypothetical protein
MPPVITSIGDPFSFVGGNGLQVSKSDVDSTVTFSNQVHDFQVRHYVLKDSNKQAIGLFVGPVDINSDTHFTLFAPNNPEAPTQPLDSEELDPIEYDTHIAFETLPVLEVWHYVTGGVIVKFPA